MAAQREAAFRREYESNRLLAGIAGFPKLYGQGKLDGQPAIVMEWVEGQTLEEARRHLSVDDDGRLSPQVATAIGRDLFDLLSRMALVDGGLVHRDVSPANVMVCTREASLEEQAARGSFDLKLIDFGSTVLPARASSMTVRYGAPPGGDAGLRAARDADLRRGPRGRHAQEPGGGRVRRSQRGLPVAVRAAARSTWGNLQPGRAMRRRRRLAKVMRLRPQAAVLPATAAGRFRTTCARPRRCRFLFAAPMAKAPGFSATL